MGFASFQRKAWVSAPAMTPCSAMPSVSPSSSEDIEMTDAEATSVHATSTPQPSPANRSGMRRSVSFKQFPLTEVVHRVPSSCDLSEYEKQCGWYNQSDYQLFAQQELERRRSNGISSTSALLPDS